MTKAIAAKQKAIVNRNEGKDGEVQDSFIIQLAGIKGKTQGCEA